MEAKLNPKSSSLDDFLNSHNAKYARLNNLQKRSIITLIIGVITGALGVIMALMHVFPYAQVILGVESLVFLLISFFTGDMIDNEIL